ncbi:MAG: competence/damage-inducible protein A [Phyllobacteriaceae bacterium]|nr:competence/damage-inducible protein A [Phyllobacteriaceae bacterium]
MDVDLLEKTEIRIEGIVTEGTNLTELAAVAAAVLNLPPEKLMVIDVRPDQVAFDVLLPTLRAEDFFGSERDLLDAVVKVAGVRLTAQAAVHSAGILGAIALDRDEAAAAIERSTRMGSAIRANRRPRVVVFPTGFELEEGRIEDTNTPYLVKLFSQAGFVAEPGHVLADRLESLTSGLEGAASEAGLIVTTGGVGAEDKDFSVEAIERLDPDAATPWLVRFTRGQGRHVKDGIRIGVGEWGGCLLVALPGPHDEVRLTAPILLRGYKERWPKAVLAERIAEAVRGKFRTGGPGHAGHDHAGHGHHPHAHAHHHDSGAAAPVGAVTSEEGAAS